MDNRKTEELSIINEGNNITVSDIPMFIETRFREMHEIQKQISNGEKLSREIELGAQAAMKAAEQSVEDAKKIKESNMTAPTFGHKKEAIIEVQNKILDVANVELAQADTISKMGETLQSTAAAQLSAAKSNTMILENQKKIVDITRAMLAIGTKSIAMNRSILGELKLKLNNASKEELETFEMQQIMSVITELEQQRDIMVKQDQLEEIVSEHEDRLNQKDCLDTDFDERITNNEDINKQQEEELEAQRRADVIHDERLDQGEKVDREQNDRLDKIDILDEKQSESISNNAENINTLFDMISKNKEEYTDEVKKLSALVQECKDDSDEQKKITEEHCVLIEKLEKDIEQCKAQLLLIPSTNMVRITLVLAVIGCVLGVINFFI